VSVFSDFDKKTRLLLLGSRDRSTRYDSVSVLTILKHVEKSYPGVTALYGALSEIAHPNFEGVCFGYSEIDHERHETAFRVKLHDMWGDRHDSLFAVVAAFFEHEYNEVWAPQQEHLERWFTENDARLNAARQGP